MLAKFLNNNQTERLFEPSDRILLTVSGGIDSVAMLHLFQTAGIDFAIAHCNFKLRGKESDGDQNFVKELAVSLNKEFFTINFETNKYSNEHGVSIQMAARDMRYNWFREIASKNNFSKIATAHNRDDIVETILLNISRGTGIRGLTGIAPINGIIIRPMLFASRAEIEEFISVNQYQYREDSSNAEIKYKRNLVRHQIIPLFKELNPSFAETIISETNIFQSVCKIYQGKLDVIKKNAVYNENDRIMFDIPTLKQHKVDPPILYDLLEPYGFSKSDIHEIYHSFNSQPGKKFYSQNFILIKDREQLIIETLAKSQLEVSISIDKPDCSISFPLSLKFNSFSRTNSFKFPNDQNSIAIDFDTINFPLIIRHWQKGDTFYPLGASGRKKLSNFYTDRKIPILDKDKIWILTSAGKIIWIIGYQIDDKVKITNKTKNILLIERIG
jgi:tRNA(Ile)-lysidine synthase